MSDSPSLPAFRAAPFWALLAASAVAVTACSKPDTAFDHADANDDGKLQASEVEVVVAEAVYYAADANGDEVVVFQEWLKVFPKADKAKFSEADTDGAAGLTLEEATESMREADVFDKLISKIDTNGDGIIDKDEAAAFYDAFQAAEGENDIQKLEDFLSK